MCVCVRGKSEIMTACVQMVSTPYSGCNYDHFDFIRTTVTQAEQLCYDVCSFRPENIRGLFIDSPNTTAADLVGFFPPSRISPYSLISYSPSVGKCSHRRWGEVPKEGRKFFPSCESLFNFSYESHTHTHTVGSNTALPLWHHRWWQRAKDNRNWTQRENFLLTLTGFKIVVEQEHPLSPVEKLSTLQTLKANVKVFYCASESLPAHVNK